MRKRKREKTITMSEYLQLWRDLEYIHIQVRTRDGETVTHVNGRRLVDAGETPEQTP